MKKFFILLVLIPIACFSQNKKHIKPIVIFDIPINNIAFSGLSSNVGALFGRDNFVQIGVFVGYRQHSDLKINKTYSLGTFSFMWRVPIDKFDITPMFTYANGTYQDLSMRLGYVVDKNKTISINIFTSSKMGSGVGTTIHLK